MYKYDPSSGAHWDKYYRWDPFNFREKNGGLGHGPDSLLGINPDAEKGV